MNKKYTIIIPIYNEISRLQSLLSILEEYSWEGHEILIVNDGSNDGSEKVLRRCQFIKLINLSINKGKGTAIIKGLQSALNEKIIIFDGDLELNPLDIKKFFKLNKKNKIYCILGSRFKKFSPYKSTWDFGNYIFILLFNLMFNTNQSDVLCCAKAFYKEDVHTNSLKSSKFDIDIEILYILTKKYKKINTILIDYKRRTEKQGKKISYFDSINILKRILAIKYNF